MSVLWSKVWRDLFLNRGRTSTILLTIALGLFALGVVVNLYATLNSGMLAGWQRSNPAQIYASVAGGFNRTQEQRLARIPGVAAVESQTGTRINWKNPGETDWQEAILIARESYTDQLLDFTPLEAGTWPEKREFGLERLTAQYFGLTLGRQILVQAGGKTELSIPLTGILHSLQNSQPPRSMGGRAVFYATPLTLMNLTGISEPNLVKLRLRQFDPQTAEAVAAQIKDQLNLSVVPEIADPAKPPRLEQIQSLCLILGVLGVGVLGLSILLIVNVFNAILLQQMRQIGSLKTIGADTGQIVRIYLSAALVYGALSALLAMPLATLAAHELSSWLLALLNLDPPQLQIIPLAWGVQLLVGLLVPVLAALVPVWGGARISVRQALQNYGVSAPFGRGWLEKTLINWQGFSISWVLAARNTVRSRQRSLLTLVMLVLSGLLFMSVMSLKSSFQTVFADLGAAYRYDVEIDPAAPQRVAEMNRLVEKIPGIAHTEMHWTSESAFSFGSGHERMIWLRALPPDSTVYIPNLVAGRWLTDEDQQAIVLSSKIAAEEGVQVGDFITLTSTAHPVEWQVVGLNFDLSNNQRMAWVPLSRFSAIKKQSGFATDLLVQTSEHSDAAQSAVKQALVEVCARHNLALGYSEARNLQLTQQLTQFDVIIYLVLAMAILMAGVGGLGLMGSMFLNVAERRREIGVMRAIGGDTQAIAQIFINEGLTLGLLSWLLAAVLSAPASNAFAQALGMALFSLPMRASFSWVGVGLWLVIVLTLAALASAWPAWQAARASVRDSLVYE